MSDYKFHKYADLYPLASEEELSRLTEDIKKRGLVNPITLHEGQILDGRNRYIACQRAKVKPHFQNWDCTIKSWANGQEDVLLWVVAQNSHRRHLSTSQLAMVAAKVAEIFEEDAKKRQLAGKADPAAILQQGRSSEQAAKVVGGVSERTVCDAIKVQKVSPELAAKVLKGDITVAQAKKQLPPAPPKDSKPQKAKKVLPPLPVPEPIPEDIAVPNPKTLKVLDEIEKHLKAAYKLMDYFAYNGKCDMLRARGSASIDSIRECERLDQVRDVLSHIEHEVWCASARAPKITLMRAIMNIRDHKLCDPKWKIGDISVPFIPYNKQESPSPEYLRDDEQEETFKSLLAPFGWRKQNKKSLYFVKERAFATKDDPQSDPTPPPRKPKSP